MIIEDQCSNQEETVKLELKEAVKSPVDILEKGKMFYEEQLNNPDKFLTNIFKEYNISENQGRIAYWFYVCIVKLGIEERLTKENKVDMLNNFKPYIILNYVKILKGINVETVNDEFKDFFYTFFKNTCLLKEEEIKNKVDNLLTEVIADVINLKQDKQNLIKELDILKLKKEKILSKNADYKSFTTNLGLLKSNNETILKLSLLSEERDNSILDIIKNIYKLQRSTSCVMACLLLAFILSVFIK